MSQLVHELALAQSVLAVVLEAARGRPTRSVRLRVGELKAVTQDSLQLWFEIAAQDTPAAAARLEVEIVPGDALHIDAIEVDEEQQDAAPQNQGRR